MCLNVCRYIDQGRNPQLYTKDCIEKALEKNQQVNGKIDAYKVGYIVSHQCSMRKQPTFHDATTGCPVK